MAPRKILLTSKGEDSPLRSDPKGRKEKIVGPTAAVMSVRSTVVALLMVGCSVQVEGRWHSGSTRVI
eukprot:scaffold976_cov131-Skeletonema_menzelii.AAC.2